MRRAFFLQKVWLICFLVIGLWASPAWAQENPDEIPNTLVIGGGWQEVFKNTPYSNGGDFRLEHRWGLSLLSAAADFFKPLDGGFQIHPFMGLETTTSLQFYGFGGLIFDFLVGRHLVISPNFAVGHYSRGEGKKLGCPLEFRSTIETGLRFEGGWRVTAYLSHTSNDNIGDKNPGVEHAGFYLHIPLNP
ncbi:MAG: acyloxyacyl hydrolase [Bdellovibrionales bacterium]